MHSFNPNPVVRFVSAPCGSGKTYAACEYIKANQSLKNHIYVAPSLELIAETNKTLSDLGLKPRVITSDTHPGHVKGNIIKFLKDAAELGEVLLITWNAYVDLPYVNRRDNWQIIIDELPQLDRFYGWMLPRNLTFLTEHVDIDECSGNEQVSKVVVKNGDALQELLESERDDVNELFREFFRDLLCPNKSVFVDTESWNRLAERGEFSDDDNSNRLSFISMLKLQPVPRCDPFGSQRARQSGLSLAHTVSRVSVCRIQADSEQTSGHPV